MKCELFRKAIYNKKKQVGGSSISIQINIEYFHEHRQNFIYEFLLPENGVRYASIWEHEKPASPSRESQSSLSRLCISKEIESTFFKPPLYLRPGKKERGIEDNVPVMNFSSS